MSGPTYARARGVVWRLGPDRVLLHRTGVAPESAAVELTGLVAYAWLALDEPGTIAQIVDRLREVDPSVSLVSGLAGEGATDAVASGEAMGQEVQRLVDVGVVDVIGATEARDG